MSDHIARLPGSRAAAYSPEAHKVGENVSCSFEVVGFELTDGVVEAQLEGVIKCSRDPALGGTPVIDGGGLGHRHS